MPAMRAGNSSEFPAFSRVKLTEIPFFRKPSEAMMDRFGMMLSVLCMVHCAAMPFVLAWLPMFGASWLGDETAHRWLAGGAMMLGAATFWPGFRVHRKWSVLVLGVLGLSLITHAAFAHEDDCCRVALADAAKGNATTSLSSSNDSVESPMNKTEGPKTCRACCQKNAKCDAEGPEADALKADSAMSATASTWNAWQTPLGGLLLVVAHVVNLRAKKFCCANCLCADSNQPA